MAEAAKNDLLGSLFGGAGFGKGGISPIILIILLVVLLGGGSGFGGIGKIFGGFDSNFILIFVVLLILFGGFGSFKF